MPRVEQDAALVLAKPVPEERLVPETVPVPVHVCDRCIRLFVGARPGRYERDCPDCGGPLRAADRNDLHRLSERLRQAANEPTPPGSAGGEGRKY